MPRLPHHKDNGFLPPVTVLAREGNEKLKKKKKGNLGFHTNTFRYVHTHTYTYMDMNCTHTHTHAYTVLSICLFLSHTVKVMAFIFHCATGDPKYLHCLAEAVPGDLDLGEQ